MPIQRSDKRGILGILLPVCLLSSASPIHVQSQPKLDKTVDDLGKPTSEIDGGRSTGGELPFVPLSGYSMFRRGVRLYNPLSHCSGRRPRQSSPQRTTPTPGSGAWTTHRRCE